MVMALRPEASAPSARAVLAGSGGRSVATMAAEVYTCKPHLFRGFGNIVLYIWLCGTEWKLPPHKLFYLGTEVLSVKC